MDRYPYFGVLSSIYSDILMNSGMLNYSLIQIMNGVIAPSFKITQASNLGYIQRLLPV